MKTDTCLKSAKFELALRTIWLHCIAPVYQFNESRVDITLNMCCAFPSQRKRVVCSAIAARIIVQPLDGSQTTKILMRRTHSGIVSADSTNQLHNVDFLAIWSTYRAKILYQHPQRGPHYLPLGASARISMRPHLNAPLTGAKVRAEGESIGNIGIF